MYLVKFCLPIGMVGCSQHPHIVSSCMQLLLITGFMSPVYEKRQVQFILISHQVKIT